jgi:hypothetical protein
MLFVGNNFDPGFVRKLVLHKEIGTDGGVGDGGNVQRRLNKERQQQKILLDYHLI